MEQNIQGAGQTIRRALPLWLAVVVWAALIFFFSAQPTLSTNMGVWDYILRKMAHMTEYAILWLLLWRALGEHMNRERAALALAAVLALAYAASDEFHQTFVSGRAGRVTDVGYDLAGILMILAFVLYRKKKAAAGQ